MKYLLITLKWVFWGIIFGLVFDIIWVKVFWNNNHLFYYHTLILPLVFTVVIIAPPIEYLVRRKVGKV